MYADLVNVIATEEPFNEKKIKGLIIKLCEGDCQNWDSFYYIFKAMGIKTVRSDTRAQITTLHPDIRAQIKTLQPEECAQIVNKFIDLFGGYLVLGAHFTVNVKNEVSIDCFDNIGTLQNSYIERPRQIHWTDLGSFNHHWKWFGYTHGDRPDKDKLTQSEINTALEKRFPHKHIYIFKQGPIANIQLSSTTGNVMEMGGRRRTKRNAKRNATRKRHNNKNKRTSTKKTMPFVKSTKSTKLTKLTKLTRRRK